MNFRQSASTNKKLKNCPFCLYCKITKQELDENIDNSYGNAGNAVHKTLEAYYEFRKLYPWFKALSFKEVLKYIERIFGFYWDSYTINETKCDFDVYWLCVVNGMNLKPTYTKLEYQFEFKDPIHFIGYADVLDTKNHIIGDWKTATYKAAKLRDFKHQLKLYAYAYRKEFGVNPVCWVYWNKINRIDKFKFPDETLDSVKNYLINIDNEVKKRFKTMDFPRTPSRQACFFCPYKRVCHSDLLKKGNAKKMEVVFHIKKDKLLIEGDIPKILHRRLEKHINFEVKNAHFRIKAMAARGIKWDGIKRLYRRKPEGAITSPGFMNFVWKELKEYSTSQGKKLSLVLKDWRDQNVLENHLDVYPVKLNIDFEPYKWQEECIEIMLKNRWSGCEVGTGGGKTYVASELLRRIRGKAIFLIDNKTLLMQTKKEYEDMLGFECGIVGMGKREWDYPVVLATVQTLNKNVKEFSSELAKFNVAILDEYHQSGSKSYETISKHLINTKYRFSFSATARRDDLATNIIFAVGGEVVYKKKAKALIEEGILMNPTVWFFNYESERPVAENWQNEYVSGIVENENRNTHTKLIAEKFAAEGKQVMILVKDIKNGHANWLKDNIEGAELIYGKTKDDVREEVLDRFKAQKLMILIGSISIFNKGLNIKSLTTLINVAGNAGDVATVQSIGRALRKAKGKKEAYYIDFIDKGEYLYKHSISRMNSLKKEDYPVEIKKFEMPDWIKEDIAKRREKLGLPPEK